MGAGCQQSDLGTTTILLAPMSAAALSRLASSANQAITAGAPRVGVLSAVEVLPLPQALARLGPVPAPDGGWAMVVVQQVYAGRSPGAFDVVFPLLVNQLARRTQASSGQFETALTLAAQRCGSSIEQP